MSKKRKAEPGLSDPEYFATLGELWCDATDRLTELDFEPHAYELELDQLRAWLDCEIKRVHARNETPL